MAHWHTVRQGESLPSIAERYGFKGWRTIYEHARNADFRTHRPDPFVLTPGDRLFIPNLEQRYERVETEKTHRFQLKRVFTHVRLVVEDVDGNVLAQRRYRLKVADLVFEGVTDAEGLVDQKVPAVAEEGELTVWDDVADPYSTVSWMLDIGHLDPVETVTGVQARLNNLGYDAGEVDGEPGPQTRDALRRFQSDRGLEATGEMDDATRAKLVEQHGK